MTLKQAMDRVELVGICKWRDREHTSQLAAYITGLEPPFLRLAKEWAMHLAAAETEAREWFYALREHDLNLPEEIKEYESFEHRMYVQSAEFIRQLELMREHSSAIRQSRTSRALVSHIVQDAHILVKALQPVDTDTADAGASKKPTPLALRRNSAGGWSLTK